MLSKPKQLKLLFRASEHNYKAEAFHRFCDNIEDTLTIARTEYGKTIAGYTHYKFNQVSQTYLNDASRRAFLLQLDLQEKMVPVSDNNILYCCKNLGPLFGGGNPDFGILQDSNTKKSRGNFPTAYNKEGDNKYVNGKDSFKAFTGSETY